MAVKGKTDELQRQIIDKKIAEFKKSLEEKSEDKNIKRIEKEKPEIIEEAGELVKKVYKNKNISITPRAVFAASMYISCIRNDNHIEQTVMAKLFKSNVVSMRRAAREIIGEGEYQKIIRQNKRETGCRTNVRGKR